MRILWSFLLAPAIVLLLICAGGLAEWYVAGVSFGQYCQSLIVVATVVAIHHAIEKLRHRAAKSCPKWLFALVVLAIASMLSCSNWVASRAEMPLHEYWHDLILSLVGIIGYFATAQLLNELERHLVSPIIEKRSPARFDQCLRHLLRRQCLSLARRLRQPRVTT